MMLQLVLRKYLIAAKMQYTKWGVDPADRMAYGIASDRYSSCNTNYFDELLCTGELNLLMDLARDIGRKVELPPGISTAQRFLMLPVEQHPGMIDSILLLTPGEVLTVRIKDRVRNGVPPRIYLRKKLSERHTHFPDVEDVFEEGKRQCLLGLRGTVTCSPE